MEEHDAVRKLGVNTILAFGCLVAASNASLIPDTNLAFIVSETAVTIACLATMVGPTWMFYYAYHAGELEGEYDPVTREEIIAAITG